MAVNQSRVPARVPCQCQTSRTQQPREAETLRSRETRCILHALLCLGSGRVGKPRADSRGATERPAANSILALPRAQAWCINLCVLGTTGADSDPRLSRFRGRSHPWICFSRHTPPRQVPVPCVPWSSSGRQTVTPESCWLLDASEHCLVAQFCSMRPVR